jgi:hypothetical protein
MDLSSNNGPDSGSLLLQTNCHGNKEAMQQINSAIATTATYESEITAP